MRSNKIKGNYLKFLVYLVMIVLVNCVGLTLFFRLDLTANKIYSLSEASYRVADTLSDPLTIKVFFTKNLPAPHNTTERYLRDLLEEYSAAGKRFFNYRFYDVTAGDDTLSQETDVNRKLAEDYGISPVQIRIIDNDEVKFQQAYMGLVIIHGDMIEKIPAITSTDGLEYQLTTAIQKLNNKVSALLRVKDKVKVTLYLSKSLETIAPLINLSQLGTLPKRFETVVKDLNAKHIDIIEYTHVDPGGNLEALSKEYDLMTLKWPELADKNIRAGSGGAGLVVSYKDKTRTLPVISSLKLPIIGTTYQMTDPEAMTDILSETIESMIGINQDLGYLTGHGTHTLSVPGMGMMPGQEQSTMNAFNQLVSKRYSIKDVDLKEGGVPEGLGCLIIARPTEPFSDYELFQIDQALMRGTNLALFLDAFNEIMPGQAGGYGRGPEYVPLDTGLSKLLAHYGITVKSSYVMDENCYKQVAQGRLGPEERLIYFAPMIQEKSINTVPGYMKNIKGLVAMRISPLDLDAAAVKSAGIEAVRLFSSSEKAWEMKDAIQLNPMFIRPPKEDKDKQSFGLAYMLQGEFQSYFAGKPMPEKKTDKEPAPEASKPAETVPEITADNAFIAKGKPGRIFVMACSQMLQDNMLDPEGKTTNATFILNIIDHLNNRDDIATLRSKDQSLNPLAETSPVARSVIKGFNIAVLPALVILCGFGVWLRRSAKKKHIRSLFQK
ncbi:MAG: Gldg family protein [Pseudomonadota bacterium]